VEQAVAEYPADPQAATSAAFEVFRTAVAQSTLIKSVTAQDGSGQLMAVLDTHSTALLSRARAAWSRPSQQCGRGPIRPTPPWSPSAWSGWPSAT
jgi:hypothetical protein